MTAEQMAVSVVNKLSLTRSRSASKGYYRSKLFNAPSSNNPLVAAAGPLFSLLERLNISQNLPPIINIRDNIEHELSAFHSCLTNKNYPEEFDVIAHYLLCATIDELVGKSYLRVYGTTAEFQAFTPLSNNEVGPETRFFDIVDYIKERPNQYLDIIELAYYCLISGFEGIQHNKAEGRLILDDLIEQLFQIIQQFRASKSYHLFKEAKVHRIPGHKPLPLPLLWIGILLLSVLIGGVMFSYALLENKAKSVQFGHTVIDKMEN